MQLIMNKRKLATILSLFLGLAVAFQCDLPTYCEEADPAMVLSSESAIVVEVSTGKVLFEQNADKRLAPASVTKVMTLALIFDAIKSGKLKLDDIVTVSEHAASMGGSQCFFEQGEQQTVETMIKCIEVASGNDAAVAMAEHIAGSEEAFVQMMNDKAKELGMVNTTFMNACGLTKEGHLTTARDISLMAAYLMKNYPEITNYSTIWMDTIIHKTRKGESEFGLANTNKFLNMYTGANGLKTGFTSEAGYCMAASAERNGITLIAVIMKAETKDIRNSEACKLLDFGFAHCTKYKDEEVFSSLGPINVEKGVKDNVKYNSSYTFETILTDKNGDTSEVTKEIVLNEEIVAPIHIGDVLGNVVYKCKDQVIGEVPIIAVEDVAAISYGYCVKDAFERLLISY